MIKLDECLSHFLQSEAQLEGTMMSRTWHRWLAIVGTIAASAMLGTAAYGSPNVNPATPRTTNAVPLTFGATAALTIQGGSDIFNLVVNTSVNYTSLSVSGGTGPYTWSATSLPEGLSINSSTGAITGTLTMTGLFTWTVTVIDSSSPQQATEEIFTWQVNPGQCWTSLSDHRDLQIPDLSTVYRDFRNGCLGNASANSYVSVSIKHTYVGDLIVDLVAPDGTVYNVTNREGGSADLLNKTVQLDLSSKIAEGTWRLRIRDVAAQDSGYLDDATLYLAPTVPLA